MTAGRSADEAEEMRAATDAFLQALRSRNGKPFISGGLKRIEKHVDQESDDLTPALQASQPPSTNDRRIEALRALAAAPSVRTFTNYMTIAAALPHLTPEDVPHIVAQVLREAARELDDAAEIDADQGERGETPALRTLHRHYAIAFIEAANHLRARADRLAHPTDRPAGDA